MATAAVQQGVQEEKPQERRSSGARLSTVFDVGVRSTGQFTVATKAESLSFREVIALFVSIMINAFPAVLVGILFTVWQTYVIRSCAHAVLDVLDDQPAGWAVEGFDYTAYKASAGLGHGKRLPPGAGPFNGTNVTYGNRADWDAPGEAVWADVPSMGFRLAYNGYYSIGLKGHPNVGGGYLWLVCSMLFMARPGLFSLSGLLVQSLFGSKIKGKYGHILLWIYGIVVAFLMDYCITFQSIHNGIPRSELGTIQMYCVLLWWFYHTYLMFSTAKYGYNLQGAARGVAAPVMATAVIGIVLQGVLWPIIGSVRGKGILIMRLVYWPIITEVITAPCRALLRSIPEEWADKSGLSFGMIPPVLAMAQIGRIFQYSIIDAGDMIICNFALFLVEMIFRLSVAHRDRFYARVMGCMSTSSVKSLFTQTSNVKFRCDNLVNEMAIEYWAMFVLFVQSYLLNRQSDPGAASNASIIVANFLLQFFLELICDTVCLYVEDTKLKAPVMQAWMGRKKHYPLFFGALVMGAGMYASISPLFSLCPMRDADGGFMGISCYLNEE